MTDRVLSIHEFAYVTQFEAAADMRRGGLRVDWVTGPAHSFSGNVPQVFERLVFHRIHQLLSQQHTTGEIPSELVESLSEPTVDVHCFDVIDAAVAAQRPEGLKFGLINPKWYLHEQLRELEIPRPDAWQEPRVKSFPVVVEARITSGSRCPLVP